MKNLVLVGAFAGALSAAVAYAQTPATSQPSTPRAARPAAAGGGSAQGGHTAPKPQPNSAPAPAAPTGEMTLGSVHLSKSVKADGKPLAAGTYQVRLTSETPSGNAPGQSQGLERWVEFLQGGKVKGREVVTIVPQSEIGQVQKDAPPARNSSKFETLKGGDYMRLWINRSGNHFLVHFPAA